MTYGKQKKRIIFFDTNKRHVDLNIRLQHDGLSQSEFFRMMITGYLENDQAILQFINNYKLENKKQSKEKVQKSIKAIDAGKNLERKFNLDDDEKQNIFDIIAKEHPEL